jgi:pyrimidine-nucleoside phosphorylase
MDRPLGKACGNAIEVRECIGALRGDGPDDVMDVTYALGAEMLVLSGIASSHEGAWRVMIDAINSGKALAKFGEIISAQGGDPRILDDQSILPSAKIQEEYAASRDGFVTEVAPRTIGYGIIEIRGGRRTMEDTIDPSVGFIIDVKPGNAVSRGDRLATIHARDDAGLTAGRKVLDEAILIGDEAGTCLPLVSRRITSDGVSTWSKPTL